MLRRIPDLCLLVLSSAFLVLPFHFGAAWPLAFIAFLPFFLALRRKSSAVAFIYSFTAGAVFYALLGYWLSLVSVLGFVLTAAYLSLYFGVFGWLARSFVFPDEISLNRRPLMNALYLPAFWVALEWVRSWMISGFPWALLAYSQWMNTPLIQIADITGAYGVSFLVMAVNVLLFEAARALLRPHKRPAIKALGIAGAVCFVVLFYGTWVLAARDSYYESAGSKVKVRVAVVQGNIPQDQKWNARIKNIIFEKYQRLTLMCATERSDLIVWPETAFPGYLEDEPLMHAHLRNMVRQSRTEVLIGAPTIGDFAREGVKFYNSAVLYGADGEERKRYNKVHLVPFGEYVPLGPVLGWLHHLLPIGHFSPGSEKTLFESQSRYQSPNYRYKFGVLICYEDIFPGLVREFCRGGANFLVNMTNDAWFGKTTAPYQHAQASLFRAVENRVPVVRATNTGLSCFISPEGRIVSSVQDEGQELFVTGHKGYDLILRKTPSFYTRFGDVFLLLVFFLCFIAYRRSHRPLAN